MTARSLPPPAQKRLREVTGELKTLAQLSLPVAAPNHVRLRRPIEPLAQNVSERAQKDKPPLGTFPMAAPLRQEQRVIPSTARYRLPEKHRHLVQTPCAIGELRPVSNVLQVGQSRALERLVCASVLASTVPRRWRNEALPQRIVPRPK